MTLLRNRVIMPYQLRNVNKEICYSQTLIKQSIYCLIKIDIAMIKTSFKMPLVSKRNAIFSLNNFINTILSKILLFV